jgi:hypothetical protein
MADSTGQERIIIKQTNILPQRDRFKTIWYSEEDYTSILALSIEQRKPMVHIAHDLITSYFICQKQGHAKIIERLKQDRAILAAELKVYMDRFGKIPPSDLPGKNAKG